jgi:hypothetical protein
VLQNSMDANQTWLSLNKTLNTLEDIRDQRQIDRRTPCLAMTTIP